jgi:ferric-dicitrate binding protein FerR (iron transport regulator)
LVVSLLRRLRRAGVSRTLSGEHWAWAVLALSAHLLARSVQKTDKPVASIRVQPGETLEVSLRDSSTPGALDA